MKRSVPLSRTKPLPAGTGLARGSQITRTPFRVKARRATPAETHARAVVSARSNGRCEGCDLRPATDWAHRRARSQGGPWDAANGLHLCSDCHRWQHDNPDTARRFGWTVRRAHDFRTTPVWLRRHSWCLLGADGSITAERTA